MEGRVRDRARRLLGVVVAPFAAARLPRPEPAQRAADARWTGQAHRLRCDAPDGTDPAGGGHRGVLRAGGGAAAGARRAHRSLFAGRDALLRALRPARLPGARLPRAARAMAAAAAQLARAVGELARAARRAR